MGLGWAGGETVTAPEEVGGRDTHDRGDVAAGGHRGVTRNRRCIVFDGIRQVIGLTWLYSRGQHQCRPSRNGEGRSGREVDEFSLSVLGDGFRGG